MACYTQEQIAKDVELSRPAVTAETEELSEIESIRKLTKLPDDRTGERAYREATYADEGWARPLFETGEFCPISSREPNLQNSPVSRRRAGSHGRDLPMKTPCGIDLPMKTPWGYPAPL